MVELARINIEAHARLLFEWRQQPDIRRFMYSQKPIHWEDHLAWLSSVLEDSSHWYRLIQWNNRPVGLTNLSQIDRENARCTFGMYVADGKARLRGVGAAAEFLTMDAAFNELELEKVTCEVFASNETVARMHQRFGFVPEGRFRQHARFQGKWVDVQLFSILKEEWAAARPKLHGALSSLLQTRKSDTAPGPPHLLIRADASTKIGTGHVFRMVALAQAYQDRGGGVTIACAECSEGIRNRVLQEQIAFQKIANGPPGGAADLEKTIALARSLGCSWVVLDGYHFGIEFQRSVRAAGFQLMVLDDHGYTNNWAADAILNQNIFAPERSYSSEVQTCRLLLGTCFALLRREFRRQPDLAPERQGGPVRRLLITLGGADPNNVTGTILEALNSIPNPTLEAKVLIGAGNPHLEQLRAQATESHHHFELLENVLDMPALYQWADGIVSAGGSTCWEWLFYGLPACVVTIAENQVPIGKALKDKNLAVDLGWHDSLRPADCASKLKPWLETGMSRAPRELVDGSGAYRVAALLDGRLRITVASAEESWITPPLQRLVQRLESEGHRVSLVHEANRVLEGDILFLLSFWSIVPKEVLQLNTHNLVVHGSDLPRGRGWSPVTWQILEGASIIPLCLLEAVDRVDAGPVYLRKSMRFDGHELLGEIRGALAEATADLCLEFVSRYPEICAKAQKQEGEPTYYPRRDSRHSRVDPSQPLAEQFDLLRTVDNSAYPAHFDLRGYHYRLRIEKAPSADG